MLSNIVRVLFFHDNRYLGTSPMLRNPHFYQYVLTKCQDTFFPFLVGIFCFPLCPISVSECGKPHIDSEHTSLDKQKRRQGGGTPRVRRRRRRECTNPEIEASIRDHFLDSKEYTYTLSVHYVSKL